MARDVFRLGVSDCRVTGELIRGANVIWAGEAEYAGEEDLVEVISRIAVEGEVLRPGTRVRVELKRPVVQHRVLGDLPPVAEPALRAMVEQQCHRFFRKNGKPLVIDACYTAGPGKRREVSMAAVEEPVVDAIWKALRAAGLRLETLAPSGERVGRLSLLPPAERERRDRENRLSLRKLGAVVLLLWFLVIGVAAFRFTGQRRAVEAELALVAAPVAALSEVKREMAQGAAMLSAVERDAARRGQLLDFLTALTIALPDSAFLTSLTLEASGAGYLGGYARRASEVLARLERSAVIAGPEVDGQQGREVLAGVEWERFSISFGGRDE